MRRSKPDPYSITASATAGSMSGVVMRLISIGNNTSNRNTQAALTFAQTVCVGKMA